MNTACVILAAGIGKRMRSPLPKVLHRVWGTTMLESVLFSARKLRPGKIVIVTGRHHDLIRKTIGDEGISYVFQEKPMGTGHAVSCARPALKNFKGDILILNGDTPLVGPNTLKRFLRRHRSEKNFVSVLSFIAADPTAYGRILRDAEGKVIAIVEEKDADDVQKRIREVNSGVYAVSGGAFALLDGIGASEATGEYYLTGIVSSAARTGKKVAAFPMGDEQEFMGVNTKDELRKASEAMKQKVLSMWTEKGVSFIDPDSVYIHPSVSLAKDSLVYPNVHLEGNTRIGTGAVIYPNVRIRNSRIGKGVVVKDSSVIEDSTIRDAAVIGPFAHVRPGSVVGSRAKIGNFVELKKSHIGKDTKASHLSYLGDARIGSGVNIGAGTITCNYDGVEKHVTAIEDGVFIGSDSQLIAPVRVGKGAYVAAGSTITSDVPSHSLAVARSRQRNIKDWAKRRKSGRTMRNAIVKKNDRQS